MTLKQKFAQRFSELEDMFSAIHLELSGYGYYFDPSGVWRKWATSTANLIRAACGEASSHYVNFTKVYLAAEGKQGEIKELYAVFLAAKEDYEGGFVFDVELRVSGEVFGDFVRLARHSLAEGHKDVAAVLASAALEDALKRFAIVSGLDVEGKDMQNVINALKGAGLVAGAQKTLLDAMPKLRNAALHANWDKLGEAEVGSVLGFVEHFLLTKFSE
ncbi:DUF4145 domain-containing protein [Paraburkholderia phymatum]|uniref:DUF4145 domain-containing protein n=1 Tax=Paraburkholderia phymatum (strain DSM 17167 / CIP 108236 / LMG 21445 / STM815) TaxID=391038 RepID=B2JT87_PARP8|nr:DUF4145 domain-containing protein [Paraburkholderia phymatum]ACC75790.1 hypothetical protein Bphy_6769 [Paraburkholderia phymatum STM815]